MKLKLLYRISSIIAFLLITSFMITSLASEFIGDYILIAAVKKAIFYALALLIICMILTAISAKKLASAYPSSPYALVIVKRIKYIGLNGVIFLAPLATILNYFAQSNNINTGFYLLQSLEITCGLINMILFIRMFMDEKKLKEMD